MRRVQDLRPRGTVRARGDQQQLLRGDREPAHLVEEGRLHACAQRQRVGQRAPAGELVRGQVRDDLQQRQRVAVGVPQQALAYLAGHGTVGLTVDQLGHAGRRQPGYRELRPRVAGEPAGRLVAGVLITGGDQQADRVAGEPPGDEPQRVGALVVQPLGIVDEADDAAGDLRQDAEHREEHQERVVAGGRAEPQRAPQRGRLLGGYRVELVEHRLQQLVQAAPGEPGLELHPGRAQYRQVAGRVRRVRQQGGLADAGRAGQQQGTAAAGPHLVERPGDPEALRVAPDQHAVRVVVIGPRAPRRPAPARCTRRAGPRRPPRWGRAGPRARGAGPQILDACAPFRGCQRPRSRR